MLLPANETRMVVYTKELLSLNFERNDMGEALLVLGVNIVRVRSKRFISLSQETYKRRSSDILKCKTLNLLTPYREITLFKS